MSSVPDQYPPVFAPADHARVRQHRQRALLTIARKLARRSFHVLRELGPDALEPVAAA